MSPRTALTSALLPLVSLALRNGFYRTLKELEETQWLPAETLQRLQIHRLRALLTHAANYVPFYHEMMSSQGIIPGRLASLADLQALPIVSRADIRSAPAGYFEADARYHGARFPNWTSGSTGEPFYFTMDRQITGAKLANYYRNLQWTGIAPGDRTLKLWRTDKESIAKALFVRYAMARRDYDVYQMEQDPEPLLNLIRRHKPVAMEAYTSAGVDLAHIVQQRGLQDIRFGVIITSAEPCDAHQREYLATTFGADIYDRYGSREFGIIAYDCEYHTGLHINSETVVVEVVDDDGQQLAPGREGRVVVTSLTNYVMPLIRYEIGDRAVLAEGECPCGRQLPRLRQITGRISDSITLPSGRRQPFLFFNVFFRTLCEPYLRQYQVVQQPDLSLLLHLALRPGYPEDLPERVAKELYETLGREVPVTARLVDQIPRTASGKMRPVLKEDGART